LGVAGVAAWIGTIGAALLTSLQLWLSGTTRLELVIPAMLGVHVLIGVGEGLITVAALTYIEQTRPDLIDPEISKTSGGTGWIVAGVIVSILAVFISPYASGNPDGLERVAEDLGFLEVGIDAPYRIFSDYSIPFLGNSAPSTILAGIVGITLVMVLVIIVGRNMRKSKDVREI
jgi:cobalt/nickel transport system permease protein